MQENIRPSLVRLFADVAETQDNIVCIIVIFFILFNFSLYMTQKLLITAAKQALHLSGFVGFLPVNRIILKSCGGIFIKFCGYVSQILMGVI